MQIVSQGGNLHEMSKRFFFLSNIGKYFKMSSVVFFFQQSKR